ncbi:YeeE/YedE family protein [Marinivivus vitaminiproducens]|uniref:YeeE/YedE family protein n=1 Tax=Marinivivus vitaminiproducens TaxID=3035935 RepID=UPI0027A4AF6F|nr:YeeE/YedE family protein [Geminicoccaceae bacterium SCSIO 64248]
MSTACRQEAADGRAPERPRHVTLSDPSSLPPVLIAGLVLGLAFGATVQRTHFCTMGAIADLVLFGDSRRARAWLLAAAVAVIGTQACVLLGLVLPPPAPTAGLPWAGALVGGLSFGFGMTRTGGCISRCLVRAGGGSLKATLVLAVVFAVMLACLASPLALPVRRLQDAAALALGTGGAGLAMPPGPTAGSLLETPGRVAALVLAAGGIALSFAEPRFRGSPRDWSAGLILGGLVVLGWLATARAAADAATGSFPQSLNFAAPVGHSLLWAATGAPGLGFAAMVALGTAGGAAFEACLRGTWRFEGFGSWDDLRRQSGGALLMGLGAVLAGGCTIGHGMSGLSALALSSLLATGAMVAGGIVGVRSLAAGGVVPWLRGRSGTG